MSDAFTRLIDALQILPNVGPKTAQRMAYTLLQQNRAGAEKLAAALVYALKQVNNCQSCNTFCEGSLCAVCTDPGRDPRRLMIVQMPADIAAAERVPYYQGGWSKVLGKEALKSDQIHPNAAGYAAFTANFAAWLREEGWLR